jgi:long-chain fatty acid transport protein
MASPKRTVAARAAALAVLLLAPAAAPAQYGPVLTGVGAVNRASAGVAVANPISPSGAVYWNPATLTAFDRSEIDFGLEFLVLDTSLSSRYQAGALGPGVPATTLAGSTRSNSTVFPLPSVGLVYRPDDSPFAFGLGVNAVAGFGVDYPGGTTNPLLGAPPPLGVGVGPVTAAYQVLQVTPSVAYEVTDRLSVAAGPNVSLSQLQLAPGLFVPPDDANGDGFPTYPGATHTRTAWGGGFTAGTYYRADTWAVGFAVRSPQWSEAHRYNTTDERGAARGAAVRFELPTVLSWGVSYSGFDRWVLAADLRYLGFARAAGFGDAAFTPAGAATGLGFRDTFAAAVTAQYRVTDRLTARGGYSYGTNPVADDRAGLNVASPMILEHIVTAGASWAVTDDFTLSLAYLHGFENSVAGPLLTARGPVPGATVGTSAAFDSVVIGGGVRFGPSRRAATLAP